MVANDVDHGNDQSADYEIDRTAATLDSDAKLVIVLHNPKAGATSKTNLINKLQFELEELGMQTQMHSDIEEAIETAKAAKQSGTLRTVIAAGGDGTASLVANRFDRSTPITIFPLGTENLMSKYLEISNDPKKTAQIVADGVMVRLDAGEANGRLFLVMASCGFDAEVVHRMHNNRKGNITHFSYAKPIWNSIRKYKYPLLRIRCYGTNLKNGIRLKKNRKKLKPKKIKAKWAFVFNMPRYAMGLPIVDSADGLDGKLDVCTFRNGNLINGLIYLMGVLVRRHRTFKDTSLTQATRILIDSDQEVPYQLDGDPGGYLPLEIKVLPKRLALLVPKLWARKLNIAIEPGKTFQIT